MFSLFFTAKLLFGMNLDYVSGVWGDPEYKKMVLEKYPELSYLEEDPVVDYSKFGRFVNEGTSKYRYVIKDYEGLSDAIGPGIYPNFDGVKKLAVYKDYVKAGKLKGNKWDFVDKNRDYIANFLKWATVQDDPGVKLFYVGYALELAGFYRAAIKAYYALLVHFPKTLSWTVWHTPLYLGQIAADRIKLLTRLHPELGLSLEDCSIVIENKWDISVANDRYRAVSPGRLLRKSPSLKRVSLKGLRIVEKRGGKNTLLAKYENGHWLLLVKGKPFFVKAVAYSPNIIGRSPDFGTLVVHKDWQLDDVNHNGKIDAPFEAWVDINRNNRREPHKEKVVGDFALLKALGANAIRLYHHVYNKELFRTLYRKYGIYVLLGDYLGAYAIGSGASWVEGTDYTSPTHRKNMLESVRKMVLENRDEPYVLMYVLGNENNFGVANNAKEHPVEYYKFVNEAARLIHELDPTRPVALCNGDAEHLDLIARYCPDVDIIGFNSYRGYLGFGDSLWLAVKDLVGKPVLITEFGCPAYSSVDSLQKAEYASAFYIKNNWLDIWYNRGGGPGAGNAIGGVVFEWVDEWWKAGANTDPAVHDTVSSFPAPFIDGESYEEWFGITSQGDGSDSPFLRQLRASYFVLRELWQEDFSVQR